MFVCVWGVGGRGHVATLAHILESILMECFIATIIIKLATMHKIINVSLSLSVKVSPRSKKYTLNYLCSLVSRPQDIAAKDSLARLQ